MRRLQESIPALLVMLLPVGVLIPACAPEASTNGQMITCTTDPGTGVILRCAPGDGEGDGADTCQDIDEDGDGEPHDPEQIGHNPISNDDDCDGIPDSDDCDGYPGEDGDPDADLPYDIKPQLGATVRPIIDAFAEKGSQPAAILKVTMDGGTWRLAALQNGTPFTVTADDCSHDGNRDVGRDRVFVTWSTAGGSTETDHLDIRYCER